MCNISNKIVVNGKNFGITENGYIEVPECLVNREGIHYVEPVFKKFIDQEQFEELIFDAAKYSNDSCGNGHLYLTESMYNALSYKTKNNNYHDERITYHIIDDIEAKKYMIELDGDELPKIPIENAQYYIRDIPKIRFIYSNNKWDLYVNNLYEVKYQGPNDNVIKDHEELVKHILQPIIKAINEIKIK